MNKTLILISSLFFSLLINLAHAGYGIDCSKPILTPVPAGQTSSFTFNCVNNTVATFDSFLLSVNEIDEMNADVIFSIAWPHSASDIRPGDVGIVTGTVYLPSAGNYHFDFDKAYGGEEYEGIFCKNGKDLDDCVNVTTPQQVYITELGDLNPAGVTVCSVNIDPKNEGFLYNCENTGVSFGGTPGSVALLTLGAQTYVYIPTYDGPVYQCKVLASGKFDASSCVAAASIPSVNFIDIEFQVIADQLYAYLGDGNGNGNGCSLPDNTGLWQCTVNTTGPNIGLFSSCINTSPSFAYGIVLFDIQKFNNKTYAYIPDGNCGGSNQQTFQCLIDPTTGAVSSTCPDSGAGPIFYGPSEIAFASIANTEYAYIASYLEPYVTSCTVNPTSGLLQSCNTVLNNLERPNGMETISINNKLYMYLVDSYEDEIRQCVVENDGDLTHCVTVSDSSLLAYPLDLVFWP